MLGAAVTCAAVALVASGCRRTPLLLMAVGTLAVAHGAAARDRAFGPEILDWLDRQEDSDPGASRRDVVYLSGVLRVDATPTPGGVRLQVDATRPARGRVQLHVSGELARGSIRAWTAGRAIRAPVTLRRPQALVNFGGPSPRWQTLQRPFALTGSIKSAALVEVSPGRSMDEAAAVVRRFVRDRIDQSLTTRHPQAGALITAVLIGDRAGLDAELERKLQEAGTYHVIAISGGNVALLVALCAGALRCCSRSFRMIATVTIVAVAAYGWIVGGEPSVTRAITVAILYLASGLIGLSPRPLAILRTAAVLIVLVQPLDVLDAGAWLSFGATFGIITLAPRLVATVRTFANAHLSVLPRLAIVLVAATVAAEVMIVPISASVFGRVSVAGVLLNLVAIPAMALMQIAGIVLISVATWWPSIVAPIATLAATAADALTGSSSLVDAWPWLSWRVAPVSHWWIAGYYAALLTALSPALGQWKRPAAVAAATSALVICTAPFVHAQAPRDGRVRVTVLDVGQGDAVLVQTPGHQSLLIDSGGSAGGFDIGGRVVTPAAWGLGVRRLDWLALTHGDRDHAGGAPSVTRDLAPGEIWEAVAVPRDPDRAALRALAASQGVAWRTITAGARVDVGPVQIESLHPPMPEWERQRVRNDDSLVLRIRIGRVDVLLTGDAGAEFESRLAAVASDAAIRILKVGHHGSRTSTSTALLTAFQPHLAIVSVGAGNLFGHPAPAVLERLAAARTQVFRTDRDGAVAFETDGQTVYVQAASGRTWTVSSPAPAAPLPSATPPRAR